MAAPSRCAVLAAAAGLALLAQMAGAQSNMCYPKPGKRSRLKKGPCFMVSHTLPDFLDYDMVSPRHITGHYRSDDLHGLGGCMFLILFPFLLCFAFADRTTHFLMMVPFPQIFYSPGRLIRWRTTSFWPIAARATP